MKDRDIEIMRELCEEMGIEWDDEAEGIKANGEPMDESMIDDLFLANNPYMLKGECKDGCC